MTTARQATSERTPPQGTVVRATGLRRVFQTRYATVEAVAGLDLAVRRNEIVGLLGPNGAGKTTTLRMLTTLLSPTAGEAIVAGYDLRREAAAVRRRIGYVAQGGSTDPRLRAREEVVQQCRLYGMDRHTAVQRAAEVGELLNFAALGERPIATLSGGQRRRVEIALGIVHQPELIFFDEPTTGLDPPSRRDLWDHVRSIRRDHGTAFLLCTNYLDEADTLCDRVLVIDHGRVVAAGSPDELKRRVAGDVISVEVDDVVAARTALAGASARGADVREVTVLDHTVRLTVDSGDSALAALLAALDAASVAVTAVHLHRPTLDDVFFDVTGRSLRDETPPAARADSASTGKPPEPEEMTDASTS